MQTRAQQNDTLDAICWRHYGRTAGVVESVLNANPGIAAFGTVLPHGTPVELPDVSATTLNTSKLVQLWD